MKYLDLSRCMIRSIYEDTFDPIASTLVLLNLTENRIKSLPSGVFNRIIGRNLSLEFKVDLTMNTFDCNCNLVELSALSVWHNRFINSSVFSTPVVCSNDISYQKPSTTWTGVADCNNVHVIHTENLCFTFNEKYVYPIFSIKFNENSVNDRIIRIRSGVNQTYRLWMHGLDGVTRCNSKWGNGSCPQSDYFKACSKCILIAGRMINISIDELLKRSNMTLVCISYVFGGGVKQFWPLHCATLIDMARNQWNPTLIQIIFICSAASISGIFIGVMALMLSRCSRRSSSKTPPKGVPEKSAVK